MRARAGQQGFTLLELVAVTTIIALLAATGVTYYQKAMADTRRSGLEILAHRFTTAVAMIHSQWIIQGGSARPQVGMMVDLDGVAVYLNERGWPANTDGGSTLSSDQSAQECYQLWQAVLQNPALATVEGESEKGGHRYHISQPAAAVCRYEMITDPSGTHFFDYHLQTGKVLITVPPFS